MQKKKVCEFETKREEIGNEFSASLYFKTRKGHIFFSLRFRKIIVEKNGDKKKL